MPRPIKFRVWNPGPIPQMIYGIGLGETMDINDDIADSQREFPWMQYTGLKAKLGAELWEGDIVRRLDYVREYDTAIGQVVWDSQRCAFMVEYVDGLNGPLFADEADKYEILGNIYQNKELLQS